MQIGVYIITNIANTVLYTGMSTVLAYRIQTHKEKSIDGFAKKYNCTKLVYYEFCVDADAAYRRERQIKGWTRTKKEILIMHHNPKWVDLFSEINPFSS